MNNITYKNIDNTNIFDYKNEEGKPLSLAVIGIYFALMYWDRSKQLNTTSLSEIYNLSQGTVNKLIKELIYSGYLERVQTRDKENKRFGRFKYILHGVSKRPTKKE